MRIKDEVLDGKLFVAPLHRKRISAIMFFRDSAGEASLLLHEAKEGKPERAWKEGETRPLPKTPQSWIAPTAKMYRTEDAFETITDLARKKYGLSHHDLEQIKILFPRPLIYMERSHYWLLIRVRNNNLPSKNHESVNAVEWFSESSIQTALTAMSEAWRTQLQEVLKECANFDESFSPLHQAIRASIK